MGDPLGLVVDLVNALSSRVQEVTANPGGCEFLARLMEQMRKILRKLEEHHVESSVAAALKLLTDALVETQDAVDEYCSGSFVSTMLYHETYASTLKQVADKLRRALLQIPLNSPWINADLKSDILALLDQLHQVTFEETKAMDNQIVTLKNNLEKAFFNKCNATQELKKIIHKLVEDHRASEDELKAGFKMLKKEAFVANRSQDNEREFQLNEIIEVIAEILKDTSFDKRKFQKIQECLYCPISEDIMKDPVVVKESGMTYDRSNIEE